jgi:hypothetical protein
VSLVLVYLAAPFSISTSGSTTDCARLAVAGHRVRADRQHRTIEGLPRH